ncbi:Spy/CpxP family protein refolding chaperone [Shewanella sp. VB17]|uniref:Spy/CpxP family protein refolding chaperone n=1 Tax=Shewanella sp. VB17 TaxID=2739432 RepID=UPI0015631628|nr:Spy/CpxP family protein refolding chaperone [Shewanella sp. VB17]NRD75778.1 Spy/CpxP family protein refolding chaperone [Shewanella sp. VB17]
MIKQTLLAFALTTSIVAPAIATEQPTSKLEVILKKLNFTDSQKAQADNLIQGFVNNLPSINIDKIKETKKQQLLIISNESFNENEASALIDQIQSKKKLLLLSKTKLKHDLYQILTPEQKETFKQELKKEIGSE